MEIHQLSIANEIKEQIVREEYEQKEYIPITTEIPNIQQINMARQILSRKISQKNIPIYQKQKQYYQQKYHISSFQNKQIPFCIVIPTFNNKQNNRYLNNINSITQQQYDNYHVVVIDDASTDGTFQLLSQYIQVHGLSQKVFIIRNQKRVMALANILHAARQYCSPYQIFMVVDGDDQLIGHQILQFYNSIFQKYNTWVFYTNYLKLQNQNPIIGHSRSYKQQTISKNTYRSESFSISHLRAFYTKLLLLIQQSDLKDINGQYYHAANDVAIYYPILEMSHKRVGYLPEICYMYNHKTGLNNYISKQKQQKQNLINIRLKKKPYKPLKELFNDQQKKQLQKAMNIKNNKK